MSSRQSCGCGMQDPGSRQPTKTWEESCMAERSVLAGPEFNATAQHISCIIRGNSQGAQWAPTSQTVGLAKRGYENVCWSQLITKRDQYVRSLYLQAHHHQHPCGLVCDNSASVWCCSMRFAPMYMHDFNISWLSLEFYQSPVISLTALWRHSFFVQPPIWT